MVSTACVYNCVVFQQGVVKLIARKGKIAVRAFSKRATAIHSQVYLHPTARQELSVYRKIFSSHPCFDAKEDKISTWHGKRRS